MKLPGGDRAVVDIRKLREYCLSHDHPRGKHKARVFAAALGMLPEHAEDLRQGLLAAAREGEAKRMGENEYGQRFVIEWPISGPAGAAIVLTFWIVRAGEDFPRMATCYVK